jgi:hypothetical protein
VRNGGGQVAVEGPVLLAPDELKRLAGHGVAGIRAAAAVGVAGQQDFPVVVIEAHGVVKVRVHLVKESEELVEPVFPRHARGVDVAESPLAEAARGVAGLFENLGDGHVFGGNRRPARIGTHQSVPGVLAGHQNAAGRRAHGAARAGVRESSALGRQPVHVGRADDLLAVTAEVAQRRAGSEKFAGS